MLAMPPPPQFWPDEQVPQLTVRPPQPSENCPQHPEAMPAAVHV